MTFLPSQFPDAMHAAWDLVPPWIPYIQQMNGFYQINTMLPLQKVGTWTVYSSVMCDTSALGLLTIEFTRKN